MYIVLEIQTNIDGTVGTIVNSYHNRENAESRYHEVLMYAAISALPIHSAILIDNKGQYIKHQAYIHDTSQGEAEE